ncbi:tyrosine-type recombinase/integrase [Larkinella bovis]|uniref:Tyrosine-type recombinase/integrase n=1 Tax=Larkinella bovis TaxID=683041 RepID=A0ABW0I747_9BACT
MEISRYLRQERADENGECPIDFRICWKQQKIRFSSGYKVHPDDWIETVEMVVDPATGRRRKRKKFQTLNRAVNRKLDVYSNGLEEYFDKLDYYPTIAEVRAELARIRQAELGIQSKQPEKKQPEETAAMAPTLFEFWDQYMSDHTGLKAKHYVRHFKATKDHLQRFAPWADFKDITLPFANRFLQYMMKQGVQDETAYKQLKHLRVVMRYARKSGIVIPNDFEDFPSYRSIIQREALKWDEVVALQNVDLSGSFARQRDIFLFQCYTGLRWSDLKHVRPGNMIEIRSDGNEMAPALRLIQEKGRRENLVPLTDQAVELLKKYDGTLPVISGQKYNVLIKEVARKAGLNRRVVLTEYYAGQRVDVEKALHEIISSHMGRHTFAMIMLDRKVDITDLSDLMGHGSISTTMIYRTIRGEDKIKVMQKAWGKQSAKI